MVERRLPIRTATVMAGDLLVNAFESFAARPEPALDDVADFQLSRAPVAGQQTRVQRPFTLIVPPPLLALAYYSSFELFPALHAINNILAPPHTFRSSLHPWPPLNWSPPSKNSSPSPVPSRATKKAKASPSSITSSAPSAMPAPSRPAPPSSIASQRNPAHPSSNSSRATMPPVSRANPAAKNSPISSGPSASSSR